MLLARRSIRFAVVFAALVTVTLVFSISSAQSPPFGLPMNGEPGASTWYVSQWYGNTITAARNAEDLYHRGQGIHFGVDFAAPCGTEVVAIADGDVFAVDGPYGSDPHHVVLQHDNGYFSLYGHLQERSHLEEGQRVSAGERVGQVGDPAGEDCVRAPHLHLEIRRNDMTEAVNPVPLIDADWRRLSIGSEAEGTGFAVDFENPRRWQVPEEQPEIRFFGDLINTYQDGWFNR